jgi:U2 small nuclear ribonucleoprotein A'
VEIENVVILKSKYNPSCIDLSHNSIKELSGFQQQFNSLRMLNLSFNSISSIQKDLGLYLVELDTLLLDENHLIHFEDFMDGLKSLKKLKYLSLLGNEVRNRRDYKEKMLEGLLQQGNLRYLDYEKVKKS